MKTRILRRKFLDIKNFFIRVPRGGVVERVKVLIKRLSAKMPDVKYFSVEQVARLPFDTEVPRDVKRQGGWRRMKPSARQRSCFTATTRKGWRSVLLEDIVDIFDMDEKYGIVMALQKGYVPRLGFQIGGQAASGCANLWAADTEEQERDKEDFVVRHDFDTNVFAERWCDDVVYIWDKNVMPKTRMLLQRLQASDVYGETLELEAEAKDADTAFGFVFRTAGGTLILRSIPSYAGNALPGFLGSSSMQSGLQEMPEGRQIASIVGRVIRLLDMTNEEEEWVRWSVMRLGAELRICDYDCLLYTSDAADE